MSSKDKEVGPGGFWVQYTDSACLQLERLEHPACTSVQEKFRVIAAVDPYAHGRMDETVDHRDRRVVRIEDLMVTFWVSSDVYLLTVVDISPADFDPGWDVPLEGSSGSHRMPEAVSS